MVSIQEKILTINWLSNKDLKKKIEEILSFIGSLDEKLRKTALVMLVDRATIIPSSYVSSVNISRFEDLGSCIVIPDEFISENKEFFKKILDDDDRIYNIMQLFSDDNDHRINEILEDTASTRYEKNDVIEVLKLKAIASRLGIITNRDLESHDWLSYMLRSTMLQQALSGDLKDDMSDELDEETLIAREMTGLENRKLLKKLVAKKVWGIEYNKPVRWS
jgi:hypothetical protein